jgi:CheY-like chemotaxis protein/CHASE3 domain sensor protein
MAQIRKHYSWLANQPMQNKILLAMGLLLTLFIASTAATLSALKQQGNTLRGATHTYEVLLNLGQVQRAAQAIQTSARGYALNLGPDELTRFSSFAKDLDNQIANLRALTIDNPLQQSRIDRLDAMGKQWESDVSTYLIAPLQALPPGNATQQAAARQDILASFLAHRTARIEDMTALLDQMAGNERGLLAIRSDKLEQSLALTRMIDLSSALLCILFGLLVIRMTYRLITHPIRQITDLMTRLANHDHSIEVHQVGRRDEIGEIAKALQVFKQMAIDMQAQSWLKSQVSDIARKLQETTSHREFGHRLTAELAPLLHVGVGLYYLYDLRSERLDLLGSYGLRQSWNPVDMYVPGEGLAGQCAIERRTIVLDQVPANYVHIHSASGDAAPTHLVLLPVMFRDELVGVLELAGFQPLDAQQMQLLEQLLPIVALTQENLSRAISTHELLLQTQEQADELRASELVMRQQKEVLRDSNDALYTKTAELEEQSARLAASEEELRIQAEELQASNEELRDKTDTLNHQKLALEALQHETEEKAAELARASQYKSDFLANMSHELRTPLNSLLILSRSLSDNDSGNLDAEQVESALIIHDSGANLLRLINDILDLSKIEAGKMELVLDELPLADLQRTLHRTFNHVAQERQLDFEVVIEPGMPPALHTDGPRLEQVINNLLSNAFKFTSHGSVSLRIGRPADDATTPPALAGQAVVTMAVSDTGIGIPAEKFQQIFHAFEQVDASTSRQYGGTGLGLAISRRIVELLGGDITLQSEAGHGSTFTVWLPETASASAIGHTPGTSRPMRETALARSSALLPESIEDDRAILQRGETAILIVEDDPAFARILADMIHRKNYRVLAAADGESGLALAREFHPTGILLDVMLPGMDGWTVIERLKNDAQTRHIPVHFISATDEEARGRELGAVGFLTKPVSRESIGHAFERLLHFAEGHMRHLLVVDDDDASRLAVRTMLRDDAVDIDEAASANEALEKIGATRYDCIVLDLGLPDMDGMDLLDRLAANHGQLPPVVVYSARELNREENLRLRQFTDSIVVKGARSPERLLDEVSLFLHSIQHTPRHAGARPHDHGELAGRHVLLVDDDMRNLFALSKVLRGWGINVNLAQDGQKALKMLDEGALEGNLQTELVLMDIMMPVMDGYETMRAIRAQPRLAQLPIIALTAKAMRGDREKCLEAGANDYLSKPIDIDKLASMIRVWLHR